MQRLLLSGYKVTWTLPLGVLSGLGAKSHSPVISTVTEAGPAGVGAGMGL